MNAYLKTQDKTRCCGCKACAAVCPTKSVSFVEDSLGFFYPQIDQATCLRCGRCESVCQYHKQPEVHPAIETFAAKTRDADVIQNSSSGGVFTELAKETLSRKGVVYGAAFDSSLRVAHIRVTTETELVALQKSKYVQSDTGGVYEQVKQDIDQGKLVLFSGTPCQVAALRSFMRKPSDSLICVDVACHGAPSPTDFERCKRSIENKYKGKLIRFDFRTKARGWTHMCSFATENDAGKQSVHFVKPYQLPYYYFFLHGYNFRDSCYACPYASLNRVGDITLADCWNVESLKIDFETKNGTSLVLANTELGRRLLDSVSSRLEKMRVDNEFAALSNQPFRAPCKKPERREAALQDVVKNGYRPDGNYLSTKELLIERIKGAIPLGAKKSLRALLARNRKA